MTSIDGFRLCNRKSNGKKTRSSFFRHGANWSSSMTSSSRSSTEWGNQPQIIQHVSHDTRLNNSREICQTFSRLTMLRSRLIFHRCLLLFFRLIIADQNLTLAKGWEQKNTFCHSPGASKTKLTTTKKSVTLRNIFIFLFVCLSNSSIAFGVCQLAKASLFRVSTANAKRAVEETPK
jgi:hypothetical protein